VWLPCVSTVQSRRRGLASVVMYCVVPSVPLVFLLCCSTTVCRLLGRCIAPGQGFQTACVFRIAPGQGYRTACVFRMPVIRATHDRDAESHSITVHAMPSDTQGLIVVGDPSPYLPHSATGNNAILAAVVAVHLKPWQVHQLRSRLLQLSHVLSNAGWLLEACEWHCHTHNIPTKVERQLQVTPA
jgi:hypothetical protein